MAAINPTAGSNLNSTPAPKKQTLSSNYIDFTSSSTEGWAQQYLPDIIAKEAEVFGNRTISGFLSQVGAEEPMSADRVIWSEQGRLHLSVSGVSVANAGTITGATNHGVRVGQTIVLSDGEANPTITKCYVSVADSAAGTLTALPYSVADVGSVAGFVTTNDDSDARCSFFVYGSEFKKGDSGMTNAVTPQHKTHVNKPIIIKDKFEVSGSDTSSITCRSENQRRTLGKSLDMYSSTTNVVLCALMPYLRIMPRLSIDITPEEHQKLKAIAALKGESIKDYVLKRTLGDAPALDDMSEGEAVAALADFLKPRIDQARRGELSTKSMADIRREAHEQAGL